LRVSLVVSQSPIPMELIVLPLEGFYTAEEQRAVVYEYLALPYGAKARFLTTRGLSRWQVTRWRQQVFADTLEYGLVPRGGTVVNMDEAAIVKRLLDENEALKSELATRDKQYQQQLAAKDDELAVRSRAVDALGKAIEILHHAGDGKNSTRKPAAPDHSPDPTPGP
ncbi:hypothetical protein CLV47_1411, partial [Antricoccus suffuscus]